MSPLLSTPSELSPLCLIAAGLNITSPPLTHSVKVPSRPKPQAADPCLCPILHLTAHPTPISLGFFGFRGFHHWSKLWVSLGFIVEVIVAFLSPLLWFSTELRYYTILSLSLFFFFFFKNFFKMIFAIWFVVKTYELRYVVCGIWDFK